MSLNVDITAEVRRLLGLACGAAVDTTIMDLQARGLLREMSTDEIMRVEVAVIGDVMARINQLMETKSANNQTGQTSTT